MRADTCPVLLFGFSVEPGTAQDTNPELPATPEKGEQWAGSGLRPQCASYPCYVQREVSFPKERPRREPLFQKADCQPSAGCSCPLP